MLLNCIRWVSKITHLGNTITNCDNMLNLDMEYKTAKYISRNNDIIQEFFFATPRTNIKINSLYNMSWYGSCLWDLLSPSMNKIEGCYNRSVKFINAPCSSSCSFFQYIPIWISSSHNNYRVQGFTIHYH